MSVSVKESVGVVTINEIHSQAVAVHVCSRFQIDCRAAGISMLPGSAGYQVVVPGLCIAEVERILQELRIELGRK